MPFPLAHPAAVLPLSRLGLSWLNPAALVVGSIVPDTSYFLARWGVEVMAHHWAGAILYALPAGVVALAALHVAGAVAVRRFRVDGRWLRLLGPAGPLWVTLLSLLIGACTHLAWDSVTHKGAWLAETLTALRSPLFFFLGRPIRGQHILWYLSSFGGLAIVYYAFDRAAEAALGRQPLASGRLVFHAFLAATAMLPIAAVHHLVPEPLGNFLAAGCTFALLGWMFCRLQTRAAVEGAPGELLAGTPGIPKQP